MTETLEQRIERLANLLKHHAQFAVGRDEKFVAFAKDIILQDYKAGVIAVPTDFLEDVVLCAANALEDQTTGYRRADIVYSGGVAAIAEMRRFADEEGK